VAPECSGVTHLTQTIETEVRYALKNSFAFGGINCALIIKNR
jgi:3-oxoacyl-(acyl-carrier-protein) synthase